MLKSLRHLGLSALWCVGASVGAGRIMDMKWDELPPLPPSPGQSHQAGLAGPFAGAHGDVLFVGGGANFPNRPPWNGGEKAWWNDLFVLERRPGAALHWLSEKAFKLPRAAAYGMSFSTRDGVICAGGCDAAQCFREVFQLAWNPRTRDVTVTPLPPLPEPLAYMAGAMIGQTLYVAAGQHTVKDAVPSTAFWALDLSRRDRPQEFKWQVLPTWPGPARILPVAAATGGNFYLCSGRAFHSGQPTEVLTDAYAFDPATRTWKTLPSVSDGSAPRSVMAGVGFAAGGEVLVFSGDRGDLYRELERNDLEIEALREKLTRASASESGAWQRQIEDRLLAKKKIYESHPGFERDVLAYDPARNAWRKIATSPVPGQVTTVAVPWGDAIVIPNGEIRPGVRTPNVTRIVLHGETVRQ